MTNDIYLTDLRALWHKRWLAVEAAIAEVRMNIPTDSEPQLAAAGLILESLQEFAHDHFHFFFDNLPTENQPELSTALFAFMKKYSFEPFILHPIPYRVDGYIFRTIFNQVTSDLFALERAIGQWSHSNHSAGPTLLACQQVDMLIQRSLARFGAYLPDYASAMATAERTAHARTFPYAPIGLIGIPLTAPAVPQDYLMTPHEVAHFIFWHGDVNGSRLHKAWDSEVALIESLNTSVLAWWEEIFADVASVLIAGPVAALSIQDLMLEAVGFGFDHDDGTHPIPRIRPYIHLHVLSRMENMCAVHQQLCARWLALEGDRPMTTCDQQLNLRIPTVTYPLNAFWPLHHGVVPIAKDEVIGQVTRIVDAILDRFPELLQCDSQVWVQEQDAAKLYEAFAVFLRQCSAAPAAEARLARFLNVGQWKQKYRWTALMEQYSGQAETTNTNPFTGSTWLEIFAIEGWTVGGGGPGNVPRRIARSYSQR